jgi:RecA-family ATPase
MTTTTDEFSTSGSSPQDEEQRTLDRILFHLMNDPLATDFPGLIDRDLFSPSETMRTRVPSPTQTLAEMALDYIAKHGAAPKTEMERLIREMKIHKDLIEPTVGVYADILTAHHDSAYDDFKRHVVDQVLYIARTQMLLHLSDSLANKGEKYAEIESAHLERLARIGASRVPPQALDGSFTTSATPKPRQRDIEVSKLRSWDASDYVKRITDWEYLVKPFWAFNALSVITAPAGVGKTYMALGLAEAVVKGGTFLGHEVKRKTGRVFALLSDDAPPLIKKRLLALGLDQPGMVRIADSEDWTGNGVDVLGSVVQHVQMMDGVDLAIIDAKYCFVPPTAGAGNDQAVMETVAKGLLSVATQTGASIILIDHDSKAGAHMIGSSVIGFKAFSVVLLQPVEPTEDHAGFTVLELYKQKDLDRKDWPLYRLTQDTEGRWQKIGDHAKDKRRERADDLGAKILAKLSETEGITETALVTKASVQKQAMLIWLHASEHEGVVYHTGKGQKGNPRLWWKGSRTEVALDKLAQFYKAPKDSVSVPDPIPGTERTENSSGKSTVINNGKSKRKGISPRSKILFPPENIGSGTETESSDEGQGGAR